MEEEKRVGIIKSFINAIKAFTSSGVAEDGRVGEASLSKTEREELAKVQASGNVKGIEEGLLKKYEYAIDSEKAVKDAAKKAIEKETADKTKEKNSRAKEIVE